MNYYCSSGFYKQEMVSLTLGLIYYEIDNYVGN